MFTKGSVCPVLFTYLLCIHFDTSLYFIRTELAISPIAAYFRSQHKSMTVKDIQQFYGVYLCITICQSPGSFFALYEEMKIFLDLKKHARCFNKTYAATSKSELLKLYINAQIQESQLSKRCN